MIPTPTNNKENKVNAFTLEKEYSEKYQNGMEFSAIRTEMQKRGIESEVINVVMRSLNNKILQNNLKQLQHKNVNSLVYIGLSLAGIGLILMNLTYSGMVRMGTHYIVPYGAIIGGFGIFLKGLASIRN
jgi:hypothetical protein